MKNITPMFPGFHIQTLRRKPRSAQQKLAEKLALLKQKSFKQIGEIFENFIPGSLLKPEKAGAMSRRRFFPKKTPSGHSLVRSWMPMETAKRSLASYSRMLQSRASSYRPPRRLHIPRPERNWRKWCSRRFLPIRAKNLKNCRSLAYWIIGASSLLTVPGSPCRILKKTNRYGHSPLLRSLDVDFHRLGSALDFLWEAELCSAMR